MPRLPGWIEVLPDAVERWRWPGVVRLDAGEAAAIALARRVEADLLIVDDLAGRREAVWQGLAVTGYVGIAVRAKRDSHVRLAKPLIDELIGAGLHISSAVYAEAMALAGESES